VLRGVYNFKYIDSILRDWNRHNIRTVREAAEYEEEFRLRQSRKSRSSKVKKSESKKDKYKDLYLS
ncbi:MAG: DnaD domain protein, partial [Clostridia bacterium]|nr:DnaD domain protein [Clostridia bacterium]